MKWIARRGRTPDRCRSAGRCPACRCRFATGAAGVLPRAFPGELYVGGPTVSNGYPDSAELTASRFLDLPSAEGGTATWFRTGDRVSWHESAGLIHYGRLDDQVKVRGVRVEPAEIAARLREYRRVSDAAVVAARTSNGDRTLVAFVVPTGDPAPSSRELRDHVALSVPEPVVPTQWRYLQRMPTTRNGKLDRASLVALVEQDPQHDATLSDGPPRRGVEAVVGDVWCEVLGRSQVGRTDDFLALGGHSLHAASLAWRLSERLGAAVDVHDVMTHPTVEAIPRVLEDPPPADT